MPIARIASTQHGNYTFLPNVTLNDPRKINGKHLSFAAKGLLIYLISKPLNWRLSASHLAKIHSCSRDFVYALITELENFGYLRKIKAKNGKYYDYYLKDIADELNNQLSFKPTVCEKVSVKPTVEVSFKPTLITTDIIQTTNKKNTESVFEKIDFSQLQSLYPKHRRNQICRTGKTTKQKWDNLDLETQKLAIDALKAQNKERELLKKYNLFAPDAKNLSTWVNNKSWLDGVETEAEMAARAKNTRFTAKIDASEGVGSSLNKKSPEELKFEAKKAEEKLELEKTLQVTYRDSSDDAKLAFKKFLHDNNKKNIVREMDAYKWLYIALRGEALILYRKFLDEHTGTNDG